jgi:hypothetical protein
MSALRWAGVLLAGLVTFVAAGWGATEWLVRHGWEIFGWHDSVVPEVITGAAVGAVAGLAIVLLLGSRLSRSEKAKA